MTIRLYCLLTLKHNLYAVHESRTVTVGRESTYREYLIELAKANFRGLLEKTQKCLQ